MPHINRILTDKKITRLLLTLSLPAMAASLIDIMYNVVDSIFIGHFVGNQALAALSLISSLQLFFLALGLLFSVGSASIISRSLGAGNVQRAERTLQHGFWLALGLSLIVSSTVLLHLDSVLKLLGASEHTIGYARSYGSIILWTAFVGPVNNVLIGSIRAKGLVSEAMRYVFVGALSNIFLDALFIAVLRWGGAGAAAATALSQIIVLVLALQKVRKVYQIRFRMDEPFSLPIIRSITALGFPTGLRLFLFSFSLTIANKNLSPYGVTALSSFGIAQRVLPIAMMFIFGLAAGGQPLLGINYGAGHYGRTLRIIRSLLLFTLAFSLPATAFFLISPPQIFRLFTPNPEIIAMGQHTLRWCGGLIIFWSLFAIAAEILQALGKAKESFILVVFYPLCIIFGQTVFPGIWGLYGIWAAQPFSFLFSAIVAGLLLLNTIKYLKKGQENEKNTSPN